MQIGATRWLWIRNFYGSTYGYRYLAGLSFLLEGANAYVLKREEIVGREEGLGENGTAELEQGTKLNTHVLSSQARH